MLFTFFYINILSILLSLTTTVFNPPGLIKEQTPVMLQREVLQTQDKEYTAITDIRYGDAEGNDNLMDLFLPEPHNSNTKLIVYIHGGSWVSGNKKEIPEAFIEELAGKRKYAVASINYRLVKDGKNIFPAQIEDIKRALAFVASNAKKYNYDEKNIALMGASAGAHLAMLYAYGYDSAKQVKTVVDIFGPTDLTDKTVRSQGLESNDIITRYLATADTSAVIAKEASPYVRLKASSGVPTILFHGTADELVNVYQSEKLYKKLQELHIPTQLELYPGEKHELRPEIALSVFTKIIIWFQQYYPPQ
ncbi:MAG: alpha/beta hydrolase [Agriterribacter sp.]